MEIRRSVESDLPRILEIYRRARQFMADHGNPTQWGPGWPPEELLRADVAAGKSYVCLVDGVAAGTFFFDQGPEVEPGYCQIENGTWSRNAPYGVVHRLAVDGNRKGVGRSCLEWAWERCGYLRIDTHRDNLPMRRLLEKSGFVCCGTVYTARGHSPRMAYERTEGGKKP